MPAGPVAYRANARIGPQPRNARIKNPRTNDIFFAKKRKSERLCAGLPGKAHIQQARGEPLPLVLPHTHIYCPAKANRPKTYWFPACINSGAPDTIRTYDTRFRRAVLYPLSY